MSTNSEKHKIIVVCPAFNVAHVLRKTFDEIPKDEISEILLVDDGSTDDTAKLGEQLGMTVISHERNKGYGAAQKTGYQEAIRKSADIAILIHADNQYDPTLTPKFIEPLIGGRADIVTGSRIHNYSSALKSGMPWWKYVANRALTSAENLAFHTNLSDYHNGFRAYHSSVLRSIPYTDLSDSFDFDTDIIIQCAIRNFRIQEVPHQTRYREENSQMSFARGVVYGSSILRTMISYKLHCLGWRKNKLFATK